MALFSGSINQAEQQGEKLAEKVQADLAELVQTILDKAAGYKITITLEKK